MHEETFCQFKVWAFLKRNTALLSHDEYRAGHVGFHCCNTRRLKSIRGYAVNIHDENAGFSAALASLASLRVFNEPENFLSLWDGFPAVHFDNWEQWTQAGTQEPTRAMADGLVDDVDWTIADGPLLFDRVSADSAQFRSYHTRVEEHVIKPVVPAQYLDDKTIYHLNPSGRFVIGGPHGDAGLTGRKIIIDTYGGWGAHGGGAFSGKDNTKVDRSAAYAARWVAKSLVKSGLCRRALVQLSYAIGVPHPLSVFVESYGTVKDGKADSDLTDVVNKNFDLRPGCLIRDLDLRRPIMRKTAAYGHFGREDPDFTWENAKDLTWC